MTFCSRCLLNHALRVANLVVNLCGMAMIIYSLWLLKIWNRGVADLDATASSFPTPWYAFIYTLLGVGIVVCFAAVVGHAVSNSVNPAALSLYIVFVCFILLFQIVVIVEVLFKIDWPTVISGHHDGDAKFVAFFTFHVNICRLVGVVISVAQVNVLVMAIVLRALRPQPSNHCEGPTVPALRYSFLVMNGSDSPPGLPVPATPPPGDHNCEPALMIFRASEVRWMSA
ncbi:unnamed protein product [Musa acuminata subsp. burmannicoides]